MADETFDGQGIYRIWVRGSNKGQEVYLSTGTGLLPGLFVSELGQTAKTRDVILATAGAAVTGVILKPVINVNDSGVVRNLDAASVDNESLWVQRLGFGNVVYGVYMAGGATAKKGTRLQIASEDGKLAPAAVAAASAGNPTDAELTAAQIAVVGILDEDVTTDASNDQKVKVLI